MFNEVFRSMMVFVTAATILQNGLILIGTVVNYKEVKKTVPQRAIILSTTIADLVMGTVVMPFGLYFEFNNGWDLGANVCDFWISFDILSSTASIVSIAFHSMDKYYSLWAPNRFHGHIRHKWSCLFVAITWGLSCFVALSAGASGWARSDEWSQSSEVNPKDFAIDEDIIDLENVELHMLMHAQLKALQQAPVEECAITNNPIFAVYSAMVSFYMPATVIVYYSIHIRRLAFLNLEERRRLKQKLKIKRRGRHMPKKPKQYDKALVAAARHGLVSRSRRSQLRGRERQVAILWELTVLTFLICWAPFFIAHPLSCFGIGVPDKILIVLPWLGYSHSIVNPILHAFLEPDYLRSFTKFFIRCFTKCLHRQRRQSTSAASTSNVKVMEMAVMQPAAGS